MTKHIRRYDEFPQEYHRLIYYFANDILPSLSSHPSIHQDLHRALVPTMLQSPCLLAATLSLSAAGLVSRGVTHLEGMEIPHIMGELQTAGLASLRAALADGKVDCVLLATCLIWSLADVFAAGLQSKFQSKSSSSSSWQVHLRGFRAILGSAQAYESVVADPGPMQSAMKHLGMLYMSLQTLPHTPGQTSLVIDLDLVPTTLHLYQDETSSPKINGFLGYSEDILSILRQVNGKTAPSPEEADLILGKVQGMMLRDAITPPGVTISSQLSDESSRDFALCHEAFQLATLILIYRRLYKLPSGSKPIRDAVDRIQSTVNSMTQGQPCHAWVAMSMPLFTIGCEALDPAHKDWVRRSIDQLQVCIGSSHVLMLRQALADIWRLRAARNDADGLLCAEELLRKSSSAQLSSF